MKVEELCADYGCPLLAVRSYGLFGTLRVSGAVRGAGLIGGEGRGGEGHLNVLYDAAGREVLRPHCHSISLIIHSFLSFFQSVSLSLSLTFSHFNFPPCPLPPFLSLTLTLSVAYFPHPLWLPFPFSPPHLRPSLSPSLFLSGALRGRVEARQHGGRLEAAPAVA